MKFVGYDWQGQQECVDDDRTLIIEETTTVNKRFIIANDGSFALTITKTERIDICIE